MNIKEFVNPACYALIAVVFLLLPIKMGNEANKNIPVLGAIEHTSEEYTRKALVKVTAAYATSKVINKSIAVIQNTHVSATPFGIGITFPPGELLASASDAIDRVANSLFVVLGVLLIQKLLIGMISFMCLKVFLPTGLLLLAFAHICSRCLFFRQYFKFSHVMGKFLVRLALIVWVIFPITAYINDYFDRNFIGSEYSQLQASLEKDSKELDMNTKYLDIEISKAHEIEKNTKTPASEEKDEGIMEWFSGSISKTIDGTKTTIKNVASAFSLSNISKIANDVLSYVDDMIDNLFIMLSIFVMTNVLVPLGVYCFLANMYKAIQNDMDLQECFTKFKEFQKPLQELLDKYETQKKLKELNDD